MISKLFIRSSAVLYLLLILLGLPTSSTASGSDDNRCSEDDDECMEVWGRRDRWTTYLSPDDPFFDEDPSEEILNGMNPTPEIGEDDPVPPNPLDRNDDGLIDCWRYLTGDRGAPTTRAFSPENDHWGSDTGVSRGTPLYAGGTGRVVEIEDGITPRDENTEPTAYESEGKGRNGNFVRLNFINGDQGTSIHMEFLAPGIIEGAEVTVGQFIGTANNTGWSQRSHLHYQYLEDHTENERDTSKARDPTIIHGDCDMDDEDDE